MTTLPELSDASITLDNGVAVLTLERDDVRNALTGTALIDDIIKVCNWINRDYAVGALVITGGGKAFSSGGNVKDMYERKGNFSGDPIQVQNNYRHGIQLMTKAVYEVEAPVIAALNGAAVGAGLDLACLCDIRIGCEHTKVGATFLNLGIIPGDGGAWILPRIVGEQCAAELTFSGRIVGPDEATALGILLKSVPAEELKAQAVEMARQFAAKPRQASRMTKRLLRAGQRMALNDFLDYCAGQQSLCHTSSEHREALRQFLDT